MSQTPERQPIDLVRSDPRPTPAWSRPAARIPSMDRCRQAGELVARALAREIR
jgi:hypothetical protein